MSWGLLCSGGAPLAHGVGSWGSLRTPHQPGKLGEAFGFPEGCVYRPAGRLYSIPAGSRTYHPGGRVRYRSLFWWLTFALLTVAALLVYSPNPRLHRHVVPLSLFAAALFAAGWAVGGATVGAD